MKSAPAAPFGLGDSEIVRYARHLILPEVGGAGQRRLLDSVVAIEGQGPAFEEAALFLAAAGVGTLVIDDDTVARTARGLNPGVIILAPETLETVCQARVTATGMRRLDGALAALRGLMLLLGRVEAEAWEGLETLSDLNGPV